MSIMSAMICSKCFTESLTSPMIMCEGCSKSVHIACESLNEVPEDDWYCNDCKLNNYNINNLPWVKCNICHYCRRGDIKSLKCSNSV